MAGKKEENITQIQKADLYQLTDETQKNYKVDKKNRKINDKKPEVKAFNLGKYVKYTGYRRNVDAITSAKKIILKIPRIRR